MCTWSTIDLCKEIQDVAKLLTVRKPNKTDGELTYHSMATAMVDSICQKIVSIKHGQLKASDAMELYSAVQATSLDTQLQTKLMETVDKVLTSDVQLTATTLTNCPQILLTPLHYLTALDWQKIESDADYWTTLHIVAMRLRMIGFKSIHEKTKKAFTAVIVHIVLNKTGKLPPYPWIYKCSQDLVQTFDTCTTRPAIQLSSPLNYPDKPEELGDAWVKLAYGDEKPMAKDLPRLLQLITHHTPVRSTNNLLKDATQPNGQPSGPAGKTLLQALADELDRRRGGVGIEILTPPPKKLANTWAIEDGCASLDLNRPRAPEQVAVEPEFAPERPAGVDPMLAIEGQTTSSPSDLRVPLGVFDGKADAAHQPKGLAPDVDEANDADPIDLSLEDSEDKAFGNSSAKKRPASKDAPKPKAKAKANEPKAKAEDNEPKAKA